MKRLPLLLVIVPFALLSCKKEKEQESVQTLWIVRNNTNTTIAVNSAADIPTPDRQKLITYTDSISPEQELVLRSFESLPYSSINGTFRQLDIFKNEVKNTINVLNDHWWDRTVNESTERVILHVDDGFFE